MENVEKEKSADLAAVKAKVIRVNGETEEVEPENGSDFQLEEVKRLIGCEWIEVVRLADRRLMVMDEEGKLLRKRCNVKATEMYNHPYDVIVGDVLVCDADQLR